MPDAALSGREPRGVDLFELEDAAGRENSGCERRDPVLLRLGQLYGVPGDLLAPRHQVGKRLRRGGLYGTLHESSLMLCAL